MTVDSVPFPPVLGTYRVIIQYFSIFFPLTFFISSELCCLSDVQRRTPRRKCSIGHCIHWPAKSLSYISYRRKNATFNKPAVNSTNNFPQSNWGTITTLLLSMLATYECVWEHLSSPQVSWPRDPSAHRIFAWKKDVKNSRKGITLQHVPEWVL